MSFQAADKSLIARVKTRFSQVEGLPQGFRFAGIAAGIKKKGRDLGLIACADDASAAGAFTKNRLRAACVSRDAEILPSDQFRAVIVNAGNANAMTGAAGDRDNENMAELVARELKCDAAAVATSSTGTIGVALPMGILEAATPQLVDASREDLAALEDFAHAIITTDTGTKIAYLDFYFPKRDVPVRIVGIAKGSGMIHPNMATTLAYVCTDAELSAHELQSALGRSIETTFNAITVDGDSSTNDTVLAIASRKVTGLSPEQKSEVCAGIHAVLHVLAVAVAQDGEGATRLLEVEVSGAQSHVDAQRIARGIAISPLFKCGVFAGAASAWGRLSAAAGNVAADREIDIDPQRLSIRVQGMDVVSGGTLVKNFDEVEVERRLARPRVRWHVDLGQGDASFTAYSCDLSYEYVRINADEARQRATDAKGKPSQTLSLSGYSPTLKHQLLVDALGYARRFSGMRIMLILRGAVLERPALLAALVRDLELIVEAAMRPLLIIEEETGAQALYQQLREGRHRFVQCQDDTKALLENLDRALPTVLVAKKSGEELARLATELGAMKVISVADEGGLRTDAAPVSLITARDARVGLSRGELRCDLVENIELISRGIERGIMAIHLVDGRIAHALVGELFTDEGVGSLIVRQTKI